MPKTSDKKEDTSKEFREQNILKKLKDGYDIAKSYYNFEQRKARLLDATDKGELWKALNAKFPPYQILPDTNYVTYVKTNLLASLYTVAKGAEVVPTSDDDKQICMDLNIALSRVWTMCSVGYYQFKAGERAALLNLGLTRVGWSEELTGGTANSFYKGNVTLKNIDPLKFMRDPFAESLETASWCCEYDYFHESILLQNPLYKEKMKQFIAKGRDGLGELLPMYNSANQPAPDSKYHNLIIFWLRHGDKHVSEYHTIDGTYMLYSKEEIKPAEFPIAELYCNIPSGQLIGTAETSKIFANNVATNLMDSIALTAEYKNQRPPKFINSQSGLNLAAFMKHGDEADKTFIVNGDASKAVHYHEFPAVSPIITNLRTSLQYGMETVTGVDGRYTGRDTGSIITTGGTEEMLNRVTLIDTPKILAYEMYTKKLTRLILAYLIEYAPKRKYFYKNPKNNQWTTLEVDFPSIDVATLFDYDLNISSELPKNKQRISAAANMMMEKQMQYQQEGSAVQIITEEEWLEMQDLPFKERMLERMGMQRSTDALKEASQVLFGYAKLIENGMDPNQALLATAEGLKHTRQGIMPGQMQQGPMPAIDMDMMQQGMSPQMG